MIPADWDAQFVSTRAFCQEGQAEAKQKPKDSRESAGPREEDPEQEAEDQAKQFGALKLDMGEAIVSVQGSLV